MVLTGTDRADTWEAEPDDDTWVAVVDSHEMAVVVLEETAGYLLERSAGAFHYWAANEILAGPIVAWADQLNCPADSG